MLHRAWALLAFPNQDYDTAARLQALAAVIVFYHVWGGCRWEWLPRRLFVRSRHGTARKCIRIVAKRVDFISRYPRRRRAWLRMQRRAKHRPAIRNAMLRMALGLDPVLSDQIKASPYFVD